MDSALPTSSLPPFHVVFYISSHGLGHLTRCVEVALGLLVPKLGRDRWQGRSTRVTFVTRGANCVILGAERVDGACEGVEVGKRKEVDGISYALGFEGVSIGIRDRDLDAGAVQKDAYCIDIERTKYALVRLHQGLPGLHDEEVAWLIDTQPNVVVSDVVGMALRAAKEAGIPTALMSNFTWPYIYQPFIEADSPQETPQERDDAFEHAVALEQAFLESADVFLRLPGHCPTFSASLDSSAIDIPLIVRPQQVNKEAMRAQLGISQEVKVCLVMVGGISLGIDGIESLLSSASFSQNITGDGPPTWICFVTESVLVGATGNGEPLLPAHIRVVPSSAYTPDYVAMSDVVLGKVGYGTVSECLATGTPLVYVKRENFAEEAALVGLLNSHRAGVEMKRDHFLSGSWEEALAQACGLDVVPADTSGAREAAALIQDMDNMLGRGIKD
jgi:L-arabinokinase